MINNNNDYIYYSFQYILFIIKKIIMIITIENTCKASEFKMLYILFCILTKRNTTSRCTLTSDY